MIILLMILFSFPRTGKENAPPKAVTPPPEVWPVNRLHSFPETDPRVEYQR